MFHRGDLSVKGETGSVKGGNDKCEVLAKRKCKFIANFSATMVTSLPSHYFRLTTSVSLLPSHYFRLSLSLTDCTSRTI